MKNVELLLKKAQNLKSADLKIFADKIFELLKNNESDSCEAYETKTEKCRKCEGTQIVKFGKDKNGKQRYKCQSCGCTFTNTSFSVVSHSHCSFDIWKKYIEALLEGVSLKKCAARCNISVQTAFIWRHKILSVLQKDQENRVMNGIVETDDMFVAVSYKGNHSKSKKFSMPRPAFKRGTDNKGSDAKLACVMCAVERKGHSYGEVLGIGHASNTMLEHAFKERLLEDTIVVADKAHNIKKYFDSTNLELIQTAAHAISDDQNSPPEIKGVYHIQNVNNLHNRFRKFIRNYNGVSTKYLNHYVGLYIWIENHKKIDGVDLFAELQNTISTTNSHISAQSILNLPPLPCVA